MIYVSERMLSLGPGSRARPQQVKQSAQLKSIDQPFVSDVDLRMPAYCLRRGNSFSIEVLSACLSD